MLAACKQFSQGISVAVCASMSIMTLGYMVHDVHTIEKNQIKSVYEKQIKVLNEEIDRLKYEKASTKFKILNK
jgi:hypothetical protein